MYFTEPAPKTVARRVMLPVEDAVVDPCSPIAPDDASIPALAVFKKGYRDTIDFGIDFTDWLKANYGSKIKTSVWAAGGNSPQVPTIASQVLSPVNESIVVLSGGAVDDVYYLDCTTTFMVTQPTEDNAVVLPERIIVRRVHVIVVSG
jgi:hypothetical protein